MTNKRFAGVVEYWCIHKVNRHLPEDFLLAKLAEDPGYDASFLSAMVVKDELGRWESGTAMRTSLISKIDLDNMTIETENSIYHLHGPGRISTKMPKEYDFEVGRSVLLLSNFLGGGGEDPDGDEIVLPKTH